jgi:hypothetical protein
VDLVVVSGAELGMPTESSLADVYARAQAHGLALAPAEVGPLPISRPTGWRISSRRNDPINTWAGEPVILVLVNGGAGLILIGTESSANAKISATSRLLFVRPRVLAEER